MLARFRTRVKLLRAWKGLAVGGCAGCVVAFIWSALDFFQIEYASWVGLAACAGAGALLGLVTGLLLKLPDRALASSLDRRAGLKDRLGTSAAPLTGSSMAEAQRADAAQSLASVRPAAVYPVRITRWHAGFLALGAVASAVFLLGNSSFLLSARQRKDQVDLQKVAPALEKVAKPLLDQPDKTPDERDLAHNLEQYHQELKRGRIPKEQALQKANELAAQTQKLGDRRNQLSQEQLQTAQQSLDQMRKQGLEHSGLTPEQAETFKSAQNAQEQENVLAKQIQDLQKMLDQNKDASGKPLTQQERAQLTDKLKQLEKQLELSQRAADFLRKLESQPEFKELAKLMSQMGSANPGQPQSLTQDQIEQMIRAMEEIAKKYGSEKGMKELLRQLIESLKNQGAAGNLTVLAKQLLALMQMPGMYGHPGPGNGQELYFANLHKIPLSKNPSKVNAKGIPLQVVGDRQAGGTETYVELKGPSGVGQRTAVPYMKVLPKYKKEAEQALERDQIPPEDQSRVKNYFKSLEDGSQE